jgi:hypothetical protein
MRNVIITLDGVAFQDFEVPEKIAISGGQRLAVHQLIGGGRVIDALGNDDGEIVLSGIFSGIDAARRAQALDAARALGVAVPLIWDGFFYIVFIAEFAVEYRKPWWIPFSLRCVVVSDPVAELAALAAPLVNIISDDLFSATSLSGQAGVSIGGVNAASMAGFAVLQTSLSSGVNNTGTELTTNSQAIVVAPDAETGVAVLNRMAMQSGQLAGLTCASGYVNRAAVNLANELS